MKKITVAEMLANAADDTQRERLTSMLAKTESGGFVMYENTDMSSSNLGARSFLAFGEPWSMRTAHVVTRRHPWLYDLPSQRQYPVAYCIKGE